MGVKAYIMLCVYTKALLEQYIKGWWMSPINIPQQSLIFIKTKTLKHNAFDDVNDVYTQDIRRSGKDKSSKSQVFASSSTT